jgi:hypothetical protein
MLSWLPATTAPVALLLKAPLEVMAPLKVALSWPVAMIWPPLLLKVPPLRELACGVLALR